MLPALTFVEMVKRINEAGYTAIRYQSVTKALQIVTKALQKRYKSSTEQRTDERTHPLKKSCFGATKDGITEPRNGEMADC